MVKVITRTNPDATLDVIITNISALYQPPTTLPPLDNDVDETGKPSDHLIVVMKPLSTEFSFLPKRYKVIKYRPFPDSGIRAMGQWIKAQSWHKIYEIGCPNLKAEKFEEILMEKVNLYFPEKTLNINENDQPWVDSALLRVNKLQKREYNKRNKSKNGKIWTNYFQKGLIN